MATVRTCDRCGGSCTVIIDKPNKIRCFAFDAYQPRFPDDNRGTTTVADLCEACADQIRRAMTEPLPRRA